MQRQGAYTLDSTSVEKTSKDNDNEEFKDKEAQTDTASGDFFNYQLLVTVMCFLLWISQGMESSLRGTTFPDQRDRLGVTSQDMGIIYSAAAFVALISCFLSGVLIDLFYKKTFLLVSAFLSIAGISLMVMKFLTSYALYFFLYLVYRFTIQACDAIGNVIILRTWGERSTGPMYAIHLGYYVGGTIGPFIVRPFLSPDEIDSANCTMEMTHTTPCMEVTIPPTDSPPRYPEGSRLEIPFLIPSSMMLAVAVCFFVLYNNGTPKGFTFANIDMEGKTSLKKIFNPKTCIGDNQSATGLFLLISFPFIFFFIVAYNIPISSYLYTYATESNLGFTKQEAALIDGIYYFCAMMGRFFSMVIARWFVVEIIFNVDVTMITIIGSVLALYGKTDKLGYVICAWSGAFFSGPLWPGSIAWENKYITVTASAFFLVKVGQQIGDIVFEPIYARFFDEGQDPESAMYGAMIFSSCLLVLSFVRQMVGFYQGPRFQSEDESNFVEDKGVEVMRIAENDCKI